MSSLRYRSNDGNIFLIKAKGVRRDLSREQYFSVFQVIDNNTNELIGEVVVGLTEHLIHLWGIENERATIERLLLQLGFEKIEESIDEGYQLKFEYIFTALNTSHHKPEIDKECPNLSRNTDFYICEKAAEEEHNFKTTTTKICNNCDFPLFFQKCQFMVDVKTKGVYLPNGIIQMRRVEEFTCKKEMYSKSPGLCFTRECFEPSYSLKLE